MAYDYEEGFKIKSDFAADKRLGSIVAWAASHDAKYSEALRTLAERLGRAELAVYRQCKWTNCGECKYPGIVFVFAFPEAR